MKYFALILFSLLFIQKISAQDSLILINGKIIPVKSAEVKENSVVFRTLTEKSKLKSITSDRLYSVRFQNGTEKIIYEQDSLDTLEFNIKDMGYFVKGEQDASLYYHNGVNLVAGFAVGFGSSLGGFFGLIGPPLYSTVIGSFSPNMERQKVSDPSLLLKEPYKEGYTRKARDRKIRNSLLSGLAGLAVGIAVFSIANH